MQRFFRTLIVLSINNFFIKDHTPLERSDVILKITHDMGLQGHLDLGYLNDPLRLQLAFIVGRITMIPFTGIRD